MSNQTKRTFQMELKQIIETLQSDTLVPVVQKSGGEQLGPPEELDIVKSILEPMASHWGRPEGFVFSAPKGVTRKLETALQMSYDGQHDEAIKETMAIVSMMEQACKRLVGQMTGQVSEDRVKRCLEVILGIDRILEESIEEFKLQAVAVLGKGSIVKKERGRAIMLSLGERALGAMVMKPLCIMLTELHDLKFVYLDPMLNIKASKSDDRFTDLLPDVEKSVDLLRGLINFRRVREGDMTIVMPGFYMAVDIGGSVVVTMPFNGSDISADILSLALGVEPLYIKRVVGVLPESTMHLIEIQRGLTTPGTKPSELVADFVLQRLIEEGKPLHIYDTATNERRVVPARTPVVSD